MAELQMNYFKSQLQLALDYDLPVNIYSRYAGHYCIDTVRDRGLSKVQMHAYDGSVKSVRKGISYGYYFSIPSSAAQSASFQRLITEVPIERMLLETDSPYMGQSGEANTFQNISFFPTSGAINSSVILPRIKFIP